MDVIDKITSTSIRKEIFSRRRKKKSLKITGRRISLNGIFRSNMRKRRTRLSRSKYGSELDSVKEQKTTFTPACFAHSFARRMEILSVPPHRVISPQKKQMFFISQLISFFVSPESNKKSRVSVTGFHGGLSEETCHISPII